MTNHIEELMKAAGVSKYKLFRQYNYAQVPHGKEELQKSIDAGIECVNVRNPKGEDCIYWNELHYPAFTPAKQLELIKLIGKKHRAITYIQGTDYYAMQVNPVLRAFGMYYEAESFEEVIAITTLELLKVNELNKLEVKRILED